MIHITEGSIPLHTYQYLRVASGLSPKTNQAAEIGLPRSIFLAVAKDGDEYIGMGRIIGDGGCFCQVVDICVLPAYQGQGIGKQIMQSIISYIRDHLPESCYVSLIADGDASYLYESFGFRETLPKSKGMYLDR